MPIDYQTAEPPLYAGRFPVMSVLEQAANSLSAGQYVELTPSGLNEIDGSGWYPNEGETNDTMTDWAMKGDYSPITKMMHIIGTPAGFTGVDGGEHGGILTYDSINNDVFNIRNPFNQAIGHCYSTTALSLTTNIVYKSVIGLGSKLHSYNLTAGTEGATLDYPDGFAPNGGGLNALAWVPHFGVNGGLILTDNTTARVHFYDESTGLWDALAGFPLATVNPFKNNSVMCHYHPVTKKVIVGTNGDTVTGLNMVTETGIVESTNPPPIVMSIDEQSFVADPNSNLSLYFNTDDMIYPLDTSTGVWGTPVTNPMGHANADATFSISDLGVIVLIRYAFLGNSKLIVYKHTD